MTKTVNTPTAHAEIGGSTCGRVLNCGAALEICRIAPKLPSSAYADEGTMLHDAIAELLINDRDPESMIGFTRIGHTLTEELFDELFAPALRAFDDVLDIVFPGADGDCELMIENKVVFPDIPDSFGTSDVIAKGREEQSDTAMILDWKFGRGVEVEAHENTQGMYYARAAMRTFPRLFKGIKRIAIVIVQPAFEPAYSIWWTTPKRLERFERELAAAARNPDGVARAGSWCRFAACEPFCPLREAQADEFLGVDLNKVKASIHNKFGDRRYDPFMVADIVQMAFDLESWAKSVRTMAHHALEQGHTIPGFKLKARRSHRVFAAGMEDEVVAICEDAGLDESVYRTAPKLKGPKPILDALEARAKETGSPDARDDLSDMKALIEKPENGTTLTTEDDPAPGVLSGVEAFAALANLPAKK